jgi:predicted nucleic acid-binding protein
LTAALDATFLLYFVAPPNSVGVPLDSTGKPVDCAKDRVAGLVADLERSGTRIIVPTPALSEMMVRSGVVAGQSYISIMRKSKSFKIVAFDEKSAVEVAIMAGHTVKGEKGKAAKAETYAKLKYDRQIVAIAHTEGATTFYTDDKGQTKLAKGLGMKVVGLADCPIPTTAAQRPLPLQGGSGEAPVKS